MKAEQHVHGAEEVARLLEQVPSVIEKRIVRQSFRDGMNIVAAKAKQGVPRKYSSAGRLAATIRVTSGVRGGRVRVGVRMGNKKKAAQGGVYYGGFVEGGTKPHRIVVKRAKGLALYGNSAGGKIVKGVQHPGAKPANFMRNALAVIPQALDVVVASAKRRIESWWASQGRK